MTPDQIRRERMNRGFSLRALGRKIEVPEQSLRRLEAGQGISLAYAKKVADFFEVTVLDLIEARPESAGTPV